MIRAPTRFDFALRGQSLRSRTIQPCTRFAGTPEASSHSAFSYSAFSFLFIFLAVQHFCCSSRRQHSPLLRPEVLASRVGAGRHGATSLRGQVSSATSLCEQRIQFLSDAVWCLNGSNTQLPWSGRGTLIFRHDTGRQFWSGCVSLHQALRISCPLDLTVTIFHCG